MHHLTPSAADGPPPVEPPRRLRADAAVNRGRIVGIARAVFAAEGTAVPMAEIARRAGVGLATAFRHFATPEDLLTEVIAGRVTACVAAVTAALEDPDAGHAFRTTVEGLCERQADDRGLAPALLSTFLDGDRFPAERGSFERAFTTLTERAHHTGGLSTDFHYADLLVLLKANAGVITLTPADPGAARQASRRLVACVLRSFGTEDATTAQG
ncbi:TetR/AcrR family transcriptional regulator [Streptantibioticus silvisoli]|uniref:Helix-turn-helix domain-containing protein n=1 Tax=Streptantibioticus silvisoli TaxID=2705255 RepID=A0ABT6W0U3_9ACTN|nr:TetR/AcrR family transcriptional regulator [Streptantibioticus silvisoli]MDI5963557.1 helix-turn-helix domain-containing protein [Streptantibioticus silvisoli]